MSLRRRSPALGRPIRSLGERASFALLAAPLLLGACGTDLPEPDVSVRCSPGAIELTVTNVGDETARYTVSVEIERAGLVETEQYSTNEVPPGETTMVTDNRPVEEEECKVSAVEVFS